MSAGEVVQVDARGRLCPQPIVDAARATRLVPSGTVLELLADDPAAAADIPAWCRMRGHRLVGVEALPPEDGGGHRYLVEIG